MSKINSSLQKLSGDPKTTSSVIESVQQASTPGMTPLKVVLVGLILEGSMPILRTVYPEEQVQAAATIHEDSCEMESVNDGIKDQCSRTAMTDTGRMVPAIEGDQNDHGLNFGATGSIA